jgi:flagellar biosynthetic protein FliR
MDSDGLNFIVDFYTHIDLFLLIFARVLGFVMVLPLFTTASIPTLVKVLLSMAIAYLIFALGKMEGVFFYDNLLGYGTLIAQEVVTGISMAFVVYIVFAALYFAGQLIDYQIGFSMVNVFDPISQIQVPVVGNLLYLAFAVILIQAGGLNAMLGALFQSFEALPAGAARLVGNQGIVDILLNLLGSFFISSVRFAMPVVGSVLVVDVALGLLVKAVPQMNVFVVGIPLKLLMGLLLLYIIAPIFTGMYQLMFDEAYRAMVNMVRSLL